MEDTTGRHNNVTRTVKGSNYIHTQKDQTRQTGETTTNEKTDYNKR